MVVQWIQDPSGTMDRRSVTDRIDGIILKWVGEQGGLQWQGQSNLAGGQRLVLLLPDRRMIEVFVFNSGKNGT
jgi:hypothetical protein